MINTSANEVDWDSELELFDDFQIPDDSETTEAATLEQPVPRENTDVDTIKDLSDVLYFDIECIPDYDRQGDFNLPAVPADKPVLPIADLMDPDQFLSQTISDIGGWFGRNNPCDEWLDLVESEESKTSGKKGNRKGVFDLIKKARDSKSAVADAEASNRKRMATCPEMLKIVSIGMAVDDQQPKALVVGIDDVTEEDCLTTFWAMATRVQRFCGFNIAGYDLPAIMTRSILLGVPSSRMIDLAPHKGQVLDLMVSRFGRYPEKGMGLKQLARLYRIPIPCDGVDGSQVEEMFRSNPQSIASYVLSDVQVSKQLHKKWSGYFCS